MLIAIEGIDGSGKGTHSQLLLEKFKSTNVPAEIFSFPNYGTTLFGKQVGRYLNGEFGDLSSVSFEFASILYAGDRFEKKEPIVNLLNSSNVVICDRYTPSNLAHQGCKAPIEQRENIFKWIEELEYEVFKIPKPDIVIWLDMPVSTAVELVLKKKQRDYTESKLDLHEASKKYLESVRSVYQQLAKRERWITIKCFDEKLRSLESINCEIFNIIKTLM